MHIVCLVVLRMTDPDNMRNLEQDRYEILRSLAAAGTRDEQLDQVGRMALEQA